MQKFKKMVLLPIVFMTGCSSFWNVGDEEFSCYGMPGDTPESADCLSAREAYFATNDGTVPRPIVKESSDKYLTEDNDGISMGESVNERIVRDYVSPNLPDRPVPVRTPATVMRIWVSPWEDDSGDLNTVGYIYTEIEPRRWVLGDRPEYAQATLYPLQAPTVNYNASEQRENANSSMNPLNQ